LLMWPRLYQLPYYQSCVISVTQSLRVVGETALEVFLRVDFSKKLEMNYLE
ncbi:hypothetical protein RUM43_012567, partial [Polyplax serrata]